MERADLDKQLAEKGEIQTSLSGGPGGQNVNKRATAARFTIDLRLIDGLTDEEWAMLTKIGPAYLNEDGTLSVRSTEQRKQKANKETATKRAGDIIMRAITPEEPRIDTEPTKASVERRIEEKRQRSKRKKFRGKNFDIE